jgi:hypothetical protein
LSKGKETGKCKGKGKEKDKGKGKGKGTGVDLELNDNDNNNDKPTTSLPPHGPLLFLQHLPLHLSQLPLSLSANTLPWMRMAPICLVHTTSVAAAKKPLF